MRLLIDANLSPRVAAQLADMRFDAIHVADVGLLTAADEAILEYAAANELVIVSADTDFGELLAASPGRARPSVVFAPVGRPPHAGPASRPPGGKPSFCHRWAGDRRAGIHRQGAPENALASDPGRRLMQGQLLLAEGGIACGIRGHDSPVR